ncbi:hypothetical protein GGS21DRAFT_492851 [Xylaria nigripes]|nr:hypothetical protein GGS21DRAFT_492851 [Xylaria nigripes]
MRTPNSISVLSYLPAQARGDSDGLDKGQRNIQSTGQITWWQEICGNYKRSGQATTPGYHNHEPLITTQLFGSCSRVDVSLVKSQPNQAKLSRFDMRLTPKSDILMAKSKPDWGKIVSSTSSQFPEAFHFQELCRIGDCCVP